MRELVSCYRILAVLVPVLSFGDSYRRQPEIDVSHYEIAVELTDRSDAITASARVHVRMRRDGVARLELDLEEMTVAGVRVGDAPRPFRHRGGRLAIELDRPYREGETAVVEVRYHGRTRGKGLLVGKNRHGRRVFFAENWPERARCWIPSVDHPSDKATVEIAVVAPSRYRVVSVGSLQERRELDGGRARTRWRTSLPIPTYCMVIGVAEFAVSRISNGQQVPIDVYAFPEDAAAASRRFARSRLALDYFTGLVGAYPYEKLAHVQASTRIGGMENASAIFYTEGPFQSDAPSEAPMAHEIAHQWFGDSVTESDWDDLWLSEGFATYFDALFYGHADGQEAFRERMAEAAEKILKYRSARTAAVVDTNTDDPMKKLNPVTYEKGAWVLHMLRRAVGDRAFFEGIRGFYRRHASGNASTGDFRSAMESASGRSLEGFFRQWLYRPGWPEYAVRWRWLETAREVEVEITQQQPVLFDAPLEVAFRIGDRRETRAVDVAERTQTFRFALPARPAAVEIDPDGWMLKSVTVRDP